MNFRGLAQRVVWAGFGLWLSTLSGARPARAEPASAEGLIAGYRADAGCPDRGEFARRVRARLGAGEVAPGRRFDIALWRDARGARGRLELVGQDTGPARALAAASCDEAADALALVAALMLRDLAAAEAASPAPEQPAVRAAGHSKPRVREGQTRVNVAGAQEQAAQEASAPESTQPESETQPAPAVAPEPELPAASAAPSSPLFTAPQLSLALSGFAAFRVAPHVRPGLGLTLALSALTRAGPRLAVQLGLRATLPDRLNNADGSARFSWFAAAPALCLEGPERRLRAFACAVAELGMLRASGRASESAHAYTRFWGALGPAAGAALSVHPRVGLRLSGELLGILVRDRFSLAGQRVFRVPRLAFRAELGIWVTFW